MESLRQNSLLQQELGSAHEIEFPAERLAAETSPTIEPPSYLQLIWDRRQLLARVVVWSFLASVVIAFVIPKQYESTITLMPPDSMGGNSAMLAAVAAKADPGLASMAGNLLGMKSNGALFTSLLSSRSVQDRIIEHFGLQSVYSARYMQDARRVLASRTSIGEDRKSGIISLKMTDRDPKRARDIAQAYSDELNRLVSEVATSEARRERIFIEGRLTNVHQDLEDAEKQFSVFASKNVALDIKEQTKAMVQSAAELQGELIAAESELQGLEQIYAPANVRVKAAQARTKELKQQLRKISGTDGSSIETEGGKVDDTYPSIKQLPLLGVEWADLYRHVKIQETVYELLNQQYELARIQEAKEIPRLNVIDPASFPEKKSWPPRLLVIFILTSLSVVCVITWIIGRDYWEKIDPGNRDKQLLGTIAVALWDYPRKVVKRIKTVGAGRSFILFKRRPEQSE